ncbi:MAG: hypothetical protein GY793_09020 [Proteobacteria bacterium]|nr:hypothetical protein [Pseudomonadota bacterium]
MYDPVKNYLKRIGYKVKSEVKDCDIVAVNKLAVIIIVELKISVNLKLILQANSRKSMTDNVYIGIPEGAAVLKGRSKKREFIKLLKQLSIGLIVVNLSKGTALPLVDPDTYKPKQNKKKKVALMKEFNDLRGDPNKGGSRSGSGIITAYRQKEVDVAEYLKVKRKEKGSVVKEKLNEPKAWDILYNNVHGWFEKKGRGIYDLTNKGCLEFKNWRSKI